MSWETGVSTQRYGDLSEHQQRWQGHRPLGKYRFATHLLLAAHQVGLVEGHVFFDTPRYTTYVLGSSTSMPLMCLGCV